MKELEDATLELSNENSELREEQHISDQIIAKLEKELAKVEQKCLLLV